MLIAELRDGFTFPEKFTERKAVRSIVYDSNEDLAIMSVSKGGYHKLPGGGIEDGEDEMTALKREIKEEIGSEIEILKPLGRIIEYRSEYAQKQTSYCYVAKLKGPKGSPEFTDLEKSAGFKLEWINPKEALAILKNDKPEDYTAKFIIKRDLTFINYHLLNN